MGGESGQSQKSESDTLQFYCRTWKQLFSIFHWKKCTFFFLISSAFLDNYILNEKEDLISCHFIPTYSISSAVIF